ncbi:MAG: DUF1353 domain-containing protein [Pseudohongiellaceae bacterium]|nr:DUF1353 domain-containing protein [Pseudohongiellaceae bacterium]
MSEFKTACIVEVSSTSKKFRLVQGLVYYSTMLGRDITVPEGFETDFASIPQLLKWLIDVNGRHRRSAVVHDYLCVYGRRESITQAKADAVFKEAMGVDQVRVTQKYPMYWGVRIYQSTTGFIKGLFQ